MNTPKHSQNRRKDIESSLLFQCKHCDALMSPKDKTKHLSVCKIITDNSDVTDDITPKLSSTKCGFILNNVLHANVINVKIKDDSFKDIPVNLRDSIILINVITMNHCKISNGDWVLVQNESPQFIDNKNEVYCRIAFSYELIYNPCSVAFTDSTLIGIDNHVKVTKIGDASFATFVMLTHKKSQNSIETIDFIEFTRIVRNYLQERYVYKGMTLRVEYNGEMISLCVSDIQHVKSGRNSLSEELNSNLENLFNDLSVSNSNDNEIGGRIYSVRRETKIKIFGIDKNLLRLSDIGGYDKQIDALKDLIELPLKNDSAFKSIGIYPPKSVLLFGPSGTGKTMTINGLMNDYCCDMNCIKIDSAFLLYKSSAESENKLKSIFEDAIATAPSLMVFDNIDAICSSKRTSNDSDKRIMATFISLLDTLPHDKHIVVVALTNKPDSLESSLRRSGRFDREIEFAIPLPKERYIILKKLLLNANHDICDKNLLSMAESAYSFTGADLAYACREASLLSLKANKNQITDEELTKALKSVRPSAMREITLEVPKVYWSDIGGMELVKKRLIQAAVWPLKNPEAFERIGVLSPRGVLMYGPPGCCKTMIGKALATESGLNFLAIKGPELFNKWVGESERAVREVFRKAKLASPSILFFDEIDALAAERGVGQSTVGDRVLAQMLTELDGIESLDGVVIVAATNRPDIIDKALLRPGRLDSIIYVPLPDYQTRSEIFRIRTRKMPIDFKDNLEETLTLLARDTDGYSGAEIAAICQEAGLLALEEDINCLFVKADHFRKALQLVKPRISKEMRTFYESYYIKYNDTPTIKNVSKE